MKHDLIKSCAPYVLLISSYRFILTPPESSVTSGGSPPAPLMPRLKHLGVGHLRLSGRPIAELFPNLSSLSLGLCRRMEAARWPAVNGSGANADATTGGLPDRFDDIVDTVALPAPAAPAVPQPLAAIQNALAAAAGIQMPAAGAPGAAAAPVGVGAPAAVARGGPLEIKDLTGLAGLVRLDLSGSAASSMVQSWRRSGPGSEAERTLFPPSLRELHLWNVSSLDDLVLAAELGAACSGASGGGRQGTLGLHGCGPAPGTKLRPGAKGPEDVVRSLGFVTHLVLQVS